MLTRVRYVHASFAAHGAGVEGRVPPAGPLEVCLERGTGRFFLEIPLRGEDGFVSVAVDARQFLLALVELLFDPAEAED